MLVFYPVYGLTVKAFVYSSLSLSLSVSLHCYFTVCNRSPLFFFYLLDNFLLTVKNRANFHSTSNYQPSKSSVSLKKRVHFLPFVHKMEFSFFLFVIYMFWKSDREETKKFDGECECVFLANKPLIVSKCSMNGTSFVLSFESFVCSFPFLSCCILASLLLNVTSRSISN